MKKGVNAVDFRRALNREMFTSSIFWLGLFVYLIGIIFLINVTWIIIAGIFGLVGLILMTISSHFATKKVLSRMQWKK